MILRLPSVTEGHGQSFAAASMASLARGPFRQDTRRVSSLHSHGKSCYARRMRSPCYDPWKVLGRCHIFHEGILLHSRGLCGAAHCGLVPRQQRIKCRTWRWSRNLTVVSSGNLDWDLNSNKVFFFQSISQIQAQTLHFVFLRSYFIEYHFR